MDDPTKKRFEKLISSAKEAIDLLTDEIKKPVDEDLQDDKARNAFKSKKECFMDAKELIAEVQKLEDIMNGKETMSDEKQESGFEAGHAEQFAKSNS
jgi:hypothetical protein|tara:strand:+ start:1219 stop:1509 length:291 start_codon:yes stop_codon:yes gene_type:complete